MSTYGQMNRELDGEHDAEMRRLRNRPRDPKMGDTYRDGNGTVWGWIEPIRGWFQHAWFCDCGTCAGDGNEGQWHRLGVGHRCPDGTWWSGWGFRAASEPSTYVVGSESVG